MDLEDEQIIDKIYNEIAIQEIEESKEYQKILKKYNKLFDSIEDENLKIKLTKMNELRNEIFSESHKTVFKVGFSLGVKLIIESLNLENKPIKE